MQEENYGKLIIDSGYLTLYDEPFPKIHYISGIEKFDEQFNSKPFSETNFCHGMMFYENAIVFYIFNKDTIIKESYTKSSLIDVKDLDTKIIQIRSVNSISKILKSGALGGGFLGSLVSTAIGSVSDKLTDKFKGITSKEVTGITTELHFKNDNDTTSIVKISCTEENKNDVGIFFSCRNSKGPIEKSSACYIATVCYGDNMAPEVIKFREFRDVFLSKHYFGRRFIKFYYENAETLSNKLSKKPAFNKKVKYFVLNPLFRIICLFYLRKKR